MKHIHVCLVSDQTIPNILGIFYFKPEALLFITTEQMQKKMKNRGYYQYHKETGNGYTLL